MRALLGFSAEMTLPAVLGLVIGGSIAIASGAQAGELRPFVLPSERIPPPSAPTRPQVARPAVDEQYYADFERRARALPAPERERLATSYSARRRDALAAGRRDEAVHYERLLGILSSIR
jgi:hypothetical protein